MVEHPVWTLLIAAAMVWYTVVTVYVGVRGAMDIRTMLRGLESRDERESG